MGVRLHLLSLCHAFAPGCSRWELDWWWERVVGQLVLAAIDAEDVMPPLKSPKRARGAYRIPLRQVPGSGDTYRVLYWPGAVPRLFRPV